MEIILANPRGFCAGVDRAISIVNSALTKFGAPIYVRHEVVHNRYVVGTLKDAGAVFVEELDEVPDNSIVIFSAHGVSKAVRDEAALRQLKVFDATCPLVTKVHMEVHRISLRGAEVVLIGHAGHPEVIGTMGQYENPQGGMYLVETVADVAALEIKDPSAVYFVTQTTLSIDETAQVISALKAKYPHIQGPRKDDICYATQNRQDAVRTLAAKVDVLLVVGSKNSSNSNRLKELAEKCGTTAYLVDDATSVDPAWCHGVARIGVSAGASAPDILVQDLVAHLQSLGGKTVTEEVGCPENTVFDVPAELRIL